MAKVVCMVVADAFQLLADPTRRRLVELTAKQERSVGELVDALGLTQPAVSKQLAILREGGLVVVRREGRRRLYRTRAQELRAMRTWLEEHMPRWETRIDKLEHHLDRM